MLFVNRVKRLNRAVQLVKGVDAVNVVFEY